MSTHRSSLGCSGLTLSVLPWCQRMTCLSTWLFSLLPQYRSTAPATMPHPCTTRSRLCPWKRTPAIPPPPPTGHPQQSDGPQPRSATSVMTNLLPTTRMENPVITLRPLTSTESNDILQLGRLAEWQDRWPKGPRLIGWCAGAWNHQLSLQTPTSKTVLDNIQAMWMRCWSQGSWKIHPPRCFSQALPLPQNVTSKRSLCLRPQCAKQVCCHQIV